MNRKDLQNLIALGEGFTTEFKRVGTSGVTEADLGVKSIPRNPLLFSVLHRMEAVENIGSDIRRIYILCRDYGIAKPTIEVTKSWFTVTFPRPQAGDKDTTSIAVESEQVTEQVGRLLKALITQSLSTHDLKEAVGLKHRPIFIYSYLQPTIQNGLIEMTLPDKPRSSKQRYRLTELGKEILKKQGKEQH